MKTIHKGFVTVLIVVLIAALFIGGVYVSNQSRQSANTQTPGLKTYWNEKYGYQFEYPSEWKLYKFLTVDTDPQIVSQADAISVQSNEYELAFYAEVREEKTELGVAIVCATPTISDIKTIAGLTVSITEQQSCILSEMRDVYGAGDVLEADIPLGQRYLYLRMDTSERPRNHRQEFIELVKSFKISEGAYERTKQTSSSSPTADWKTYRNEKNGFEVKYPPFVHLENDPFLIDGVHLVAESATSSMDLFLIRYEDPSRISIDVPMENRTFADLKKSTSLSRVSNFSFQGNPAFKATFTSPALNRTSTEIYISRGQTVFNIGYSSTDDDDLVNQILSTFKFTK